MVIVPIFLNQVPIWPEQEVMQCVVAQSFSSCTAFSSGVSSAGCWLRASGLSGRTISNYASRIILDPRP